MAAQKEPPLAALKAAQRGDSMASLKADYLVRCWVDSSENLMVQTTKGRKRAAQMVD